MFHVKNHKQRNIFDPWAHLGPKRRKIKWFNINGHSAKSN